MKKEEERTFIERQVMRGILILILILIFMPFVIGFSINSVKEFVYTHELLLYGIYLFNFATYILALFPLWVLSTKPVKYISERFSKIEEGKATVIDGLIILGLIIIMNLEALSILLFQDLWRDPNFTVIFLSYGILLIIQWYRALKNKDAPWWKKEDGISEFEQDETEKFKLPFYLKLLIPVILFGLVIFIFLLGQTQEFRRENQIYGIITIFTLIGGSGVFLIFGLFAYLEYLSQGNKAET